MVPVSSEPLITEEYAQNTRKTQPERRREGAVRSFPISLSWHRVLFCPREQ